MLDGCGQHARARSPISVAVLRRVVPPVFSLLMVGSLLLADGILPVRATKYPSESSLYINGKMAHPGPHGSTSRAAGAHPRGAGRNHFMNSLPHFRTKLHAKTPAKSPKMDDTLLVVDPSVGVAKPYDPSQTRNKGSELQSSPVPPTKGQSSAPDVVTDPAPLTMQLTPSSFPCNASLTCAHNSSTENTCPNEPAPSSFPANRNQCLLLSDDTIRKVCGLLNETEDETKMKAQLNSTHLGFCTVYTLGVLVSPTPSNFTGCVQALSTVKATDEDVALNYKGFEDLIRRYDCKTRYSVKWNCTHCKDAYKHWLCSRHLKFYHQDQQVPPCFEMCASVEEMCPFFRPSVQTHAGDPSFICKDHQMKLPGASNNQGCYRLCHLLSEADLSESYCAHPAHCPLLKNCHPLQLTSSPDTSYNLTNATSGACTTHMGARTTHTGARTHLSTFLLQILCQMVISLLLLPVTLNPFPHLATGLT
ncbi:uncharacterized protein LOC131947082 [Physella acuta]|uniref:uncharacterized protein LOC131947082 n=1 Tax=Physella acuta TaxID=109671 RepID=UPI0027DAD966|nr:uncharacterized protein LOC131947082 [Physella acuta]XP_059164147.1 uncharacterized protein LOC131947082 [Physella acuta]